VEDASPEFTRTLLNNRTLPRRTCRTRLFSAQSRSQTESAFGIATLCVARALKLKNCLCSYNFTLLGQSVARSSFRDGRDRNAIATLPGSLNCRLNCCGLRAKDDGLFLPPRITPLISVSPLDIAARYLFSRRRHVNVTRHDTLRTRISILHFARARARSFYFLSRLVRARSSTFLNSMLSPLTGTRGRFAGNRDASVRSIDVRAEETKAKRAAASRAICVEAR